MVRTAPFKIDSWTYTSMLVKMYLKGVWYLYALPFVIFVIVGFWDIRFLILAAIYVFLAMPMIMAFAIIFYGLNEESRYSILKHCIVAESNGVNVVHINEDESIGEKEFIPWNRFSAIHPTSEYLILQLNSKKYSFVAVPYSSFDSKDDLIAFMNLSKEAKILIK